MENQKLEDICQYAFECARTNEVQHLELLLNAGLNVNLANKTRQHSFDVSYL